MNRLELAREETELHDRIAGWRSSIETAMQRLARIRDLRDIDPDIDQEQAEIAARVLDVRGAPCGGDSGSVIRDVRRWLSEGGGNLKHEQAGVKNYDRWSGQRSDHSYGYGPSHGCIVFQVGLTDEARKRDLTPEEIEAALYIVDCVEQKRIDGKQFRMIAQEMTAEAAE